jgi:maltose-binding protein MalE
VIAALALTVAACGGDDDDTSSETTAPAIDDTASDTEPAAEDTSVSDTTATDATDVADTGGADAAASSDLTLWVYDDGRIEILNELGAEFEEEFGVGVTVEAVDLAELRNQMLLGVEGNGPDLAIIPHDNLGALVENGAVAPADLGDKVSEYLPNAIDGFMYGGELMGVPLAIENIGFFYNTDLVDAAPTTWAEVKDVGGALVGSGAADAAIGLPDLTYNTYPLYTSYGGYIFGRGADGGFTSDDIGMTNDGMVEAMTYVKSLADEGLIPENVDWEASHVLFETGRQPFIMTGPWALNRFRDAGVPYAIAPFPAAEAGGEPGYPFLGVQGLVINANSDQLLLAQAFATEKIATEDSMRRIFEAEARPSAWTSVFELADDPDTQALNAAGVDAQPMPSIPAMGFVWDAWVNSGTLTITGELSPADALAQAVEQIETQIAES